jgi:Mrp family chromosome partitioning ATPase
MMQPLTFQKLRAFSRYSEIKQLADQVRSEQKDRGFKTLSVLSLNRGDGKTLLATTLAVTYAEALKRRVLIVDTATFHAEGSIHLEGVLELDSPSPSKGQVKKTVHPLLDLLVLKDRAFSEPGEVDEYKMDEILGGLESHYELIVIDSSAVNVRNRNNFDPFVMARHSDASILVVSREGMQSASLGTILKPLQDPSLKLIGVIANEEFKR